MSNIGHFGARSFVGWILVLIFGLVSSIIFDQAKMDWIFSRQADSWISRVKSYTTFYEYYSISADAKSRSVLCSESQSDEVLGLYVNYRNASEESVNVLKEYAQSMFDYFFYGFGIEIEEFLESGGNTTLDDGEHRHKRISGKRIMDKLRQRTQSRSNVRTLREENSTYEFPVEAFYWPNDVEKWAKISFVESGLVAHTNISMSTYGVDNKMFNNTKEIAVVFEVLEENSFRWGGNYVCEELVQEQLSKEGVAAGSFVSSQVPNQVHKANLLSKKGQMLWYGHLVGYPDGILKKIGTFASYMPEQADERLLMHMYSRPFAFSEPFLKLGKYPELGQYDAVFSVISTQYGESNSTFYLKTGTISSPGDPGLVIPSKVTGNYERYPSKQDPYDYQDPLGPLFIPGKQCSEFLLKHQMIYS